MVTGLAIAQYSSLQHEVLHGHPFRNQTLNDALVFGGVTIASVSSGGLMNCSGSSVVAGWQAVNLAMLPFLILAGGALLWLWLRPADKA